MADCQVDTGLGRGRGGEDWFRVNSSEVIGRGRSIRATIIPTAGDGYLSTRMRR